MFSFLAAPGVTQNSSSSPRMVKSWWWAALFPHEESANLNGLHDGLPEAMLSLKEQEFRRQSLRDLGVKAHR